MEAKLAREHVCQNLYGIQPSPVLRGRVINTGLVDIADVRRLIGASVEDIWLGQRALIRLVRQLTNMPKSTLHCT
jgi:hypothetical protein